MLIDLNNRPFGNKRRRVGRVDMGKRIPVRTG